MKFAWWPNPCHNDLLEYLCRHELPTRDHKCHIPLLTYIPKRINVSLGKKHGCYIRNMIFAKKINRPVAFNPKNLKKMSLNI